MTEQEVTMLGKEVSLASFRGSIKPLLHPPRSSSAPTRKKGWKLLKSLKRKGRLRTSLVHAEERFLSSLKAESAETLEKESEDREAARLHLKKSIRAKSAILTPKEVSFLTSLVESPEVDAECLDNCTQVLEKDPLYREEAVQTEEKDDSKKTKEDRRQSLLSDAIFRSEIWKALQKEECNNHSQQCLTFDSAQKLKDAGDGTEEKKEKNDEEAEQSEEFEQKEENPWNALVCKFQMMFNNDDNEGEEESGDDDNMEDEEDLSLRVLATCVEDLTEQPTVLSPPIMDALRSHLPFAVQNDNFWLKYSMVRDGAFMPTLMNMVRSSARTILAIETDKGDVFGSFTSSPWRPYGKGYYGSGEAFLWRLRKSRYTPCQTVHEQIGLESDVEVFAWSGQNRNIQSTVHMESDLIIGGGGADDSPEDDRGCGIGLTVTRDLERGFSDKCLTFDSPPLMTRDKDEGMFRITNLEVWTLTPVDSLEMAEKLEMGRQFVFDHGNFLEQ